MTTLRVSQFVGQTYIFAFCNSRGHIDKALYNWLKGR